VNQTAQAAQQLGSLGRLTRSLKPTHCSRPTKLSEAADAAFGNRRANQYARRYYNGAVQPQHLDPVVPEMLIARPFGFGEQPFFELEDRRERRRAFLPEGFLIMRRILFAAFSFWLRNSGRCAGTDSEFHQRRDGADDGASMRDRHGAGRSANPPRHLPRRPATPTGRASASSSASTWSR
jgi:hypothetical protein